MQLSHFLKIYPYEEIQAIEHGALSPADEALLTRHGVIVPDRKEE